MARDYSSRRNNASGGNDKHKTDKRPTSSARPARPRKNAPRKKTGNSGDNRNNTPMLRSGAPGCIWLLCGLLLGVAGLSVYYIASRPAGHGPQSISIDLPDDESAENSADNQSASTDQSSGSNRSPAPEKTQPRFSFYKMLPNYKVEVPAGQQASKPVNDNHSPHEAEPAANTPTPGSSENAAGDNSHKDSNSGNGGNHQGGNSQSVGNDNGAGYIIQAGAFSAEEDADHRKARLALLGVTANIVDIQTSSGKTVYRVQSNVFNSSDKARSLARRLQSHGIESMVRHAE